MSSDDGMDSILKCVLLVARGFLLLRPFVSGRIRPTLLEALSSWCLSVVGSPRACLIGGSGPCPGSLRGTCRVNRW
jgi:hypothetical protein